jgi:hypothetical protein
VAVTKKTTVRGLDVLQTVYGVIMGLGLKDVFDKAYRFFSQSPHSVLDPRSQGQFDFPLIAAAFLFTNILLIGIRFFWVPRNLRTFVVQARVAMVARGETAEEKPANWSIAASLIVIMLHAGLYYLLCSEFGLFLTAIYTNSAFQFQAFGVCAWTQASLLVLNATWILALSAGVGRRPQKVPDGVIWARSNLAFSLFALPPLLLMACRYPAPASIAMLQDNSGTFFQAFPTSPRAILGLFRWVCDRSTQRPELVATLWISVSFLTNSLLDLLKTARHYIFLEEFEDSQTLVADPRPSCEKCDARKAAVDVDGGPSDP